MKIFEFSQEEKQIILTNVDLELALFSSPLISLPQVSLLILFVSPSLYTKLFNDNKQIFRMFSKFQKNLLIGFELHLTYHNQMIEIVER